MWKASGSGHGALRPVNTRIVILFTYLIVSSLHFRAFKQALKSGGGQLTVKHVEEVSLGVLFLVDAAKKTDAAFKVKAPSTSHTMRESDSDVRIMVAHLNEKKVHTVLKERNSPLFTDPTEIGWKKIGTTTWLKDTLSRSLEVEANEEADDLHLEEVDFDYDY